MSAPLVRLAPALWTRRRPILAGVSGAVLGVLVAAAVAWGIQCGGGECHGSSGADTIYGTPNQDLIYAHEGGDLVFSGTGHDISRGQQGQDVVFGEQGADVLYGGDDADWKVCSPGSFNCGLGGGPDGDYLTSEGGNDYLIGDNGNDDLIGGGADDRLNAWSDSDGGDSVDGGAGDNDCYVNFGDDWVNCDQVHKSG